MERQGPRLFSDLHLPRFIYAHGAKDLISGDHFELDLENQVLCHDTDKNQAEHWIRVEPAPILP